MFFVFNNIIITTIFIFSIFIDYDIMYLCSCIYIYTYTFPKIGLPQISIEEATACPEISNGQQLMLDLNFWKA